MAINEILADIGNGHPLSDYDAQLLAHEVKVLRTSLAMADKSHKEQTAELGRRQGVVDELETEAARLDKLVSIISAERNAFAGESPARMVRNNELLRENAALTQAIDRLNGDIHSLGEQLDKMTVERDAAMWRLAKHEGYPP